MSARSKFEADYFAYHGLTAGRQADVRRALVGLETYMLDMRAVRGIGGSGSLVDCGPDEFRDFLVMEVSRGKHVNTVRKTANCIRPFFKWCWERGHIDADRYMRIRDVPNPRGATNQGLPRPYSRKELDRFYRQLDQRWPLATPRALKRWLNGTARYRQRHYFHGMHLQLDAIIMLALHGGLRRTEIYNLTIDDMHPLNDYVVVRFGKRSSNGRDEYRVREVPMTVEMRAAISAWLDWRKLMKPKHDRPWLGLCPTASPKGTIPSRPNAPMSKKRFNSLLPTIGHWELHRFRHTCGTEWLRAGMELEKVSRLLGHSSIQQTLGYAEVIREDVMKSARKHETEFATAVGRREEP